MFKCVGILFTLYAILSLSISFSYSQTVETIGFIPNKGQYSRSIIGDSIIGKLCGLDRDIWLTDSGISIFRSSFSFIDTELGRRIGSQIRRISNINPISLDRVKLYDSSTNVFNYYLPSCPNGLLNIRSYRKVIVESILDGIDLEITFPSNKIIAKFKYSNSISYSLKNTPTTIALTTNTDCDIIINYDTVEIGEEFSIFTDIWPYSRNFVDDTKLDSSHSIREWFTLFNGGYSRLSRSLYHPKYESIPSIQLSNSISDSLGNYYTVGEACLATNTELPICYDTMHNYGYYKTDAFINKFDNNGNLLWTTYYGSSHRDRAKTIVLNSKKEIYIGGSIVPHNRRRSYGNDSLSYIERILDSIAYGYSPRNKLENDFPLKPPPNNSYFSDSGFLFILKLDTNGKRIWSTLVGSSYGVFDYMGEKRYHISDCDFFSSAKSSKDDIYFSGTTESIINMVLYAKSDTAIYVDSNNRMLDSKTYASIVGIPIVGNNESSTWQIPLIDSLYGGRWVNIKNEYPNHPIALDTILLRTYPFILKIDSNDNLVWSTYFFTNQPINAMVVDKKDNLYIGGHTIENYLPLKEKGDGFFNDKDLIGNKNKVTDFGYSDGEDGVLRFKIFPRERRAYIAEFNSANTLIWCTYLEDSVNRDSTFTIISDMAIDINNNLLVTGHTNNKAFPLLFKKGAYYEGHYFYRNLDTDAFIMQFDSLSKLKWSSICIFLGARDVFGVGLQSLPDGRLFLSMRSSAGLAIVRLFEFNKNYSLRNIHILPCQVLRTSFADTGPREIPGEIQFVHLHENRDIDYYEAVERYFLHAPPSLNLSYTPRGSLFLSGNLIGEPFDKFIKPTSTSFIQTEPSWFYRGYDQSHSGFILKQSLCDSGNFIFPFIDSLICAGTEINIPLKVDSLVFDQFSISWYKNNKEVGNGESYTITDEGVYHMVADNIIYTDCPHYYSDTVRVSYVYDTIDLNFREDTIPLCVGANNYVISAYSLGATYLWSDSSTDSTYTISYKGDSVKIIWCHVINDCGGEDLDSVVVRFYPPYAYLGEDTLLCKGQVLNFDASILNRNLPSTANLEYIWFLNGNIVSGDGDDNELFTITEKDSGQLILHAIWEESESELGCDTAIDTLNFSYYKYDNVDFYLPTDTSICFYEDLEIDLIQTLEPNTDTNNTYLCLSSTGDTISTESNFILKDTISYYIFASNYCSKQEHTLKLSHFTDFNIKMLQPTDTAICKELFPTEIYALTEDQKDGKCYWLSENKEDTIEISPSRYISKDGTYPIILSDIYNCSQDYKITVSLKEDCSPKIDMPNVFTPNSDGINDEFQMISADNLKDFEITIFNKAGTKVYEYEGLIENFAWNGTYKNSARDVPEGAYFFVILYKDITNTTRKQAGTITLLR